MKKIVLHQKHAPPPPLPLHPKVYLYHLCHGKISTRFYVHKPQCMHNEFGLMNLGTAIQTNIFHNQNHRHNASNNFSSCIFCITFECGRSQPEALGYLKREDNKMATRETNTLMRKSDFSLFLL